MRFQGQRGTNDVLPFGAKERSFESAHWIRAEAEFRETARLFGYGEIRTPAFEDTELFVRSSGETSDIVSKQMYQFLDKGDRDITLKPEGTAPAIRAAIEHNLCPPGTVTRLSYITQVFRYERPQKGRYRQSHQFGFELLGSPTAAADAEIIEAACRFYERMGLAGLEVLLNSIGRTECRSRFREEVLKHARGYLKDQDEASRRRAEKNPIRLLDSKDPAVAEALSGLPPITDFLEPESRARLEELQRLLTAANIKFRPAPEIVRGLDYYTETVFEVQSSKLGAQSALCGGGRYDDLVQELGGPPTPAVGVGMGIERLLLVMEQEGLLGEPAPPDVFLVQATSEMLDEALRLARDLRSAGISVILDVNGRSMKSQLGQADKARARLAVIVGPDELPRGVVVVRDLVSGEQIEMPREEAASALRARL